MVTAQKTNSCKRGFTCGATCISKRKTCRSNLNAKGEKVVETFAEFVKRIAAEQGSEKQPAPKKSTRRRELNEYPAPQEDFDLNRLTQAVSLGALGAANERIARVEQGDWSGSGQEWAEGIKGDKTPESYNQAIDRLRESGLNLSDQEIEDGLAALTNFTERGYTAMRQHEMVGGGDEETTKAVDDLNGFLDKLPAVTAPMYRALNLNGDEAKDFLEAVRRGELETPASSSFSTADDVSIMFKDFTADLKVFMKVNNNKSAKSVAPLSRYPEEFEAIAPKGTKHRVTGLKYDQENGAMFLEVTEDG